MTRPLRECDSSRGVTLDFDPDDILARDPYVLLDPRLLAPLLTQFTEELGPERAGIAVTQIGALLGLRDALSAVGRAARQRRVGATPIAMPLRMRCQQQLAPNDELEIRGQWPDRAEAAARLATVGATPLGGCQLSLGYTSGWLSGLYERELHAREEVCRIDGHASCRFIARSLAAWQAHTSPDAVRAMETVELPALRAYIDERHPGNEPGCRELEDTADRLDRDDCAIHLWGPVMVIPYAGTEESLAALELIGRDPSAREVSVVVLDLEGAIVDEAHGALALEHIVHGIEAWGAEAIFTTPSPLSSLVVEELENPPLLVVKDLDEAVARAFQVAYAQRQEL